MIETFTPETFAGRVGETFRLHRDGAPPIEAALAELSVLGDSATGSQVEGRTDGRAQAFSLVFRAPGRQAVPQQIFHVEHDAIGAFDLFLVPIGIDGDGVRYEAVFT